MQFLLLFWATFSHYSVKNCSSHDWKLRWLRALGIVPKRSANRSRQRRRRVADKSIFFYSFAALCGSKSCCKQPLPWQQRATALPPYTTMRWPLKGAARASQRLPKVFNQCGKFLIILINLSTLILINDNQIKIKLINFLSVKRKKWKCFHVLRKLPTPINCQRY